MVAPVPADMNSCDPKCKCPSGPYANQAFSCESPCTSGTFDCQNGCGGSDGIDGPGCYLFTSVIEGSPFGQEGQTENSPKAYFNVAAQGDYFGNTYVEPFYDEFVLRGPEFSPGPDGLYQSSPVNGICEGTTRPGSGCPNNYAYYDPYQTVEFTRSGNSGDFFQSYDWGWTRAQQLGAFQQYKAGPNAGPAANGAGYTVTETPTITKSPLFPSWASCTNPYRIIVIGRWPPGRTFNAALGEWIPCAACDPIYTWATSSTFVEYDPSSLQASFTCPDTCSPFLNRSAELEFNITKKWDYSGGVVIDPDSPTRSGTIENEVAPQTLRLGGGFVADRIFSEITAYLIQAVGYTLPDPDTGEFESPLIKVKLGTWVNPCDSVDPNCR